MVEIQTMIGMASMPERLDRLERAVESLRPQMGPTDALRVYLNNFKSRPPFLAEEEGLLSQDALGDLGDAGKMFWLGQKTCRHYLTVDDDLRYPADYIQRVNEEYDSRHGEAITSVHGFVFSDPIEHYATSRAHIYRYTQGLDAPQPVHIVATCTTNFGPNPFGLSLDDFPKRNMTDLQLGILAQKRQIPLIVIPRPDGWIEDLQPAEPTNNYSIWRETKKELGYDLAKTARTAVEHWVTLSDPASSNLRPS